ncbi:MAG: Si-specific NAD(P)(+) transhydrogenase [Planctomycetes bacterium]|nr:Si-specific NAD(P)(+) transhydrogenase [Planctomycetota bacterium]
MAESFEYDLVVIGSGPAGQRAAVQASKLGKRVCVVEKAPSIGGACIHSATIPSKTFREAVRSLTRRSITLSMHALGTRPVRPTMEALLSRVDMVVDRESEVVHDQFDRNDVEIVPGLGRFVSPHEINVEGVDINRALHTSFALIATGSRAATPVKMIPDLECIFTSDTILSIPKIPRTMVVIGAGVIGIEYASMFAQIGVQVTVLDKVDRPISFMETELVDELVHQMRKKGVTFRLNEEVASVTRTNGEKPTVNIEMRSGKRIVADVVLSSAGRQGNIEGLDLDRIGIAADERGRIKVDPRYRTTVENIYAAGDVIGAPGLAATSYEQGRIAACDMFGLSHGGVPSHWPYGIYAVPELSMVGATEQELTRDAVPYEIGVSRYSESARGQIRGDDQGVLKLIFHRDSRKLLGVHCIGSQATEIVHIGQAVLALGGGLDYFVNTVFNYPTFAECYKVAALNALNRFRAVEAESTTK